MVLKFNEGKACEAIVRHLEAREGAVRAGLNFPEKEHHAAPVEAALSLGDQRYAIEHTGIEPFTNHMKMEAQADQRYKPIVDGVSGALDPDATFELAIPSDAFEGVNPAQSKHIQQTLIDWVKAKAPTIPKPLLAYRGMAIGPENVPGVPFAATLARYEPIVIPGRNFQIRHLVHDIDKVRTDRIAKAINDKFPKLAAHKKSDNAKTILILEANDIQLTDPVTVTDTFVPLAKDRADQPDETYLVMSCMTPWIVFPIYVNGKTYLDLEKESAHGTDIFWDADPRQLPALTNR